jgi:carbonic anhydrase/acetyltransferase-like protein (isoleucine patch superfamily)
MPTVIGADVVVGHGAVVHAATVKDACLIAIRATVLSGAVIGEGSIVGAGAVVTEGKVIPPRSLVLGVPGRVVRQIDDEQAAKVREQAARYVAYARAYRAHVGQRQADGCETER